MSVRRLAETCVATWGRWIVVLALAAGLWALADTTAARASAWDWHGIEALPAGQAAWDWHDVELAPALDLSNQLAWDWHDIELTPTITMDPNGELARYHTDLTPPASAPAAQTAWDWHDVESLTASQDWDWHANELALALPQDARGRRDSEAMNFRG